MKPARAWVLLPSRRRLDLLDPDPWAWELPLSLAQHSLRVLALAGVAAGSHILSAGERRRSCFTTRPRRCWVAGIRSRR